MNDVFKLLLEGESLSAEQMAEILGSDKASVEKELKKLQEDNILLGWRPILHPNAGAKDQVRAAIEVKITPEREGGFDHTAERISRFDEVESCYLMSGAYDLMVIVKGHDLHEVASFVSRKLATMSGVISTATHFMLRAYKETGYLIGRERINPDKPAISP